MTWINTVSGRRFDLRYPRAEDVCVSDVAHALSRVNRYTGHIKPEHYSVAEHSVRCALAAEKLEFAPAVQMVVLLHDAHEAYTGDIARPLKQFLDANSGYQVKEMERLVDAAVWRALLPARDQHWPNNLAVSNLVKHLDNWMLGWEAPRLLRKRDDWDFKPPRDPILEKWRQPEPVGWRPDRAKRYFLSRYRRLHQQLSAGAVSTVTRQAAE